MYQSVWLLAATFAVGAPGDAPPRPTCDTCAAANQQVSNAPQAAAPQEKRVGFFARLANHISWHRATTTPVAAMPAPSPALEPTPVEQPVQTVGAIASADGLVQVDLKQPLVVSKELFDKIGHADDYSWVTGQLFYVHANGGMWVLRYAGVDEEDHYGGSIVLTTAVSMRNFREGDLVSVTGEILKDGRANKQLGGPLYRATSVNMVERSDP
jgi:hypothetical protein